MGTIIVGISSGKMYKKTCNLTYKYNLVSLDHSLCKSCKMKSKSLYGDKSQFYKSYFVMKVSKEML